MVQLNLDYHKFGFGGWGQEGNTKNKDGANGTGLATSRRSGLAATTEPVPLVRSHWRRAASS
jgi:hypothetical protein